MGELLVESGVLSAQDLDAGLAHASSNGLKLGQALISLRLIDERALADALRRQGRVHCVHLTPRMVDAEVAREFGATRARRMLALPVNRIAGVTTVAMEDPSDSYRIEELQAQLATPVLAVHAEPARILEAIDAVFGADAESCQPSPWARAAFEAAPMNGSAMIVIEPHGEHVRLHASAPGCRVALTVSPRACSACVDSLLGFAGASETARSAMSSAITHGDPTVSAR